MTVPVASSSAARSVNVPPISTPILSGTPAPSRAAVYLSERAARLRSIRTRPRRLPRRGRDAMKLAAVRVGLSADLGAADATRVVVLGAGRQYEEQALPDGIGSLALGTEDARRLELSEAVCHDGHCRPAA